MTAEIVVMNKSGVALAADSKVTIGGGGFGKTYDTVNKLFSLSKIHPVGCMVFGNAEFMEYPWETIVKLYRSERGGKDKNTIVDWGEDFVDYVKSFGEVRDEDIRSNLYTVLSSWFYEVITNAIAEAKAGSINVPSPEFVDLLKLRLKGHSDSFLDEDEFDTIKVFAKNIKPYLDVVNTAVDESFAGYEDDDLKSEAIMFSFAALHKKVYSPHSSGIVITGFGKEEKFPTLVHYETDGYVGPHAKISLTKTVDITRSMNSTIAPFAQKEMVQRFMDGIDPSYAKYLHFAFYDSLLESCLKVLDVYGKDEHKNDEVKARIKHAAAVAWSQNKEAARAFQAEHFSDPIVDMVSLLPKDELPNLAESLVALTSLKRHVSHDAETVGGPIDVALISKSDGFIWIKRKHYFRSELNPHFADNYLREQDDGNGQNASRNGQLSGTSGADSTRTRHEPPSRSGKKASDRKRKQGPG